MLMTVTRMAKTEGRTYANLRFACLLRWPLAGGPDENRTTNTNIQAAVAIFHLSVKTVSRSAGRSSTASAAYRAGVEITDSRTGEVHDYRRKSGIESAELFLPAGSPEWAKDRAELWNAAEKSETRKNSTVAREFEVALPAELSADQRRQLAHDFTKAIVKKYGFAADCAIHLPGKDGDSKNHHAHILCSTRKLTPEGFTTKTRELDDRATGAEQVVEVRELFATMTNAALERAGHTARVDHRSLIAQGIDDHEPSIHLGPAATAIERRGEVSQKTKNHQERQAEAASKVAALIAIAEAGAKAEQGRRAAAASKLAAAIDRIAKTKAAHELAQKVEQTAALAQAKAAQDLAIAKLAKQEKEDDGIRAAALERVRGNVKVIKDFERYCGADNGKTEQSLGTATANIGGSESALRASDQHMETAGAAWPGNVRAVGASANDIGGAQNNLAAASGNLGRAVQAARGRQHHRHAGAVAKALGRSLKRLVPALATITSQVELHLVELAKKEREMATQKDHDLVSVAMEHREKYGYSHPSKEVLKAVDEVLIDQARARLGIPLPVEVVAPAPAIPIQQTRTAVHPARSMKRPDLAVEPPKTPVQAIASPSPEKTLLERLSASMAAFMDWLKGRDRGETVQEADLAKGQYFGPVVQVDGLHAFQRTGRGGAYTAHQLDRLDKLPALDDPKMEIKYRDGHGTVTGKEAGKEIGR
jgi:hypothetical protein